MVFNPGQNIGILASFHSQRGPTQITFSCQLGTFRFYRLLLGLTNAPATFQRVVEIILRDVNWQTCFIYLEDVAVFCKSFSAHLKDMDTVLSMLRKTGALFKLIKFFFFTDSVKYLRHIIKPRALSIIEAHGKGLNKLHHSWNETELWSFFGLRNL